MRAEREGDVLQGGRYAEPADMGGVIRERKQFGERVEGVVGLRGDEIIRARAELWRLASFHRPPIATVGGRWQAKRARTADFCEIGEEIGQVVVIRALVVASVRTLDEEVHQLVDGEIRLR
jgi:hypothetical protein